MANPGKKEAVFFTKKLLQWNKLTNDRQMPWKNEKDPYRIWLSEIILQQTRVEQGTGYFQRFLKKYPTIDKLAKAPDADVFKLWEGLGYYNRCRNLLHTARFVHTTYNGKFPSTYESILSLKGIGPYTAAAIASFAFQLPYAVVDGNVMRVLSRFFAIDDPIDDHFAKKNFQQLADALLDKSQPGIYNQSIMDFGATVCKPKAPLCTTCCLSAQCKAFRANKVMSFPVKSKQLQTKVRWFIYIIARYRRRIYIRLRTKKDIWQNLNEFILFELAGETDPHKFMQTKEVRSLIGNTKGQPKASKPFTHQLTHQTIKGYFIDVELLKPLSSKLFRSVSVEELRKLAFPRVITKHLESEKKSF